MKRQADGPNSRGPAMNAGMQNRTERLGQVTQGLILVRKASLSHEDQAQIGLARLRCVAVARSVIVKERARAPNHPPSRSASGGVAGPVNVHADEAAGPRLANESLAEIAARPQENDRVGVEVIHRCCACPFECDTRRPLPARFRVHRQRVAIRLCARRMSIRVNGSASESVGLRILPRPEWLVTWDRPVKSRPFRNQYNMFGRR